MIGPAQRHETGFEWIYVPTTNPPDIAPFISTLEPNSIKDPWAYDQDAVSAGAANIENLVGNADLPTNPYDDWSAWQAFVTSAVQTRASYGPGPFEWIVWQEPDSPWTWNGTAKQFDQAWLYAYQIIHQLRPGEPIIGPSPYFFDAPFLEQFLSYAKTNNVLPDKLSWHELSSEGDIDSVDPFAYTPDFIPSHAASIAAWESANGISPLPIAITEYQGSKDNYRPGVAAVFIADLEAARAEGTKGNWGVNGDNAQLSGLVTDPNAPQPRAIWWVYDFYDQMTGNLYQTTYATNTNGLGAYDPATNSARVLAGSQGAPGNQAIELDNLPMTGTLVVTIDQIPDMELSALAAPVEVAKYTTQASSQLTVALPNMGAWDAYTLTVQGATAPSPTPTPAPATVTSSPTPNVCRMLISENGGPAEQGATVSCP